MGTFYQILLIIFVGIIAVTLIDTLGSFSSRKLKYNYAYLTPLSLAVYTLVGFYVSKVSQLDSAIMANCLVGIYDGTIGWKIAVALDADMGTQKEQALKTPTTSRIAFMVVLGAAFACLGHWLAR
jgi:hypothetical protein